MFALRLFEDRIAPSTRHVLGPLNRVLYVLAGDARVTSGGRTVSLEAEGAWHGPGAGEVLGGRRGATLLRYELVGGPSGGAPGAAPAGVTVRRVLEHPLALDPSRRYLMRCDRVDFAPGGEALPHRHQGGGIRCLVAGELEVRVGSAPPRRLRPGDAWFESGVEPVHAIASSVAPTSFVRVSILPREIRGQSSIVYVDPAHASVKPRQYTVFVDEPVEIGP